MDEEITPDTSFGELIDKRIREEIELTKYTLDFEAFFCNHSNEDQLALVSLGELIDRLSIVNIKLWRVKDLQANETDPEKVFQLTKNDIELCKERSLLKRALNRHLSHLVSAHLRSPEAFPYNEEVKIYGA